MYVYIYILYIYMYKYIYMFVHEQDNSDCLCMCQGTCACVKSAHVWMQSVCMYEHTEYASISTENAHINCIVRRAMLDNTCASLALLTKIQGSLKAFLMALIEDEGRVGKVPLLGSTGVRLFGCTVRNSQIIYENAIALHVVVLGTVQSCHTCG